tara:strand:+ start:3251 stop:3457 length:207 start_codon:yes stop_codon:yes gene_type:complete
MSTPSVPYYYNFDDTFILTVLGMVGGCGGALTAYFLKSRCIKIKCLCIECTRDPLPPDQVTIEVPNVD